MMKIELAKYRRMLQSPLSFFDTFEDTAYKKLILQTLRMTAKTTAEAYGNYDVTHAVWRGSYDYSAIFPSSSSTRRTTTK